jgi:uncharacterized membrane protein YkoI
MSRIVRGMLVVSVALLMMGCAVATRAFAAEKEGENAPGLLPQIAAAKVSLEKGLAAAETAGKPLSAKFEIGDGKLQLSVYTKKDGKYFEVIVDHETGAVSKTEEIKGGDDLKAAQRQDRAMAKAKISLQQAVEKSLAAHAGAKAIRASAYTSRKGHAMADIDIVVGGKAREAPQKLD